MLSLFSAKPFTANSGQLLTWKVECDALGKDDWDALAEIAVGAGLRFSEVEGVPRGGLPLADALRPHCTEGPLLIVDDVLTTGGSMERHRAGRDAIGLVAFARTTDIPPWIRAIWTPGLGDWPC